MAESKQAAGDRSYQALEVEFSKMRDDVASRAGTVRDIASDEVHATVDAIRDLLDMAAADARKGALPVLFSAAGALQRRVRPRTRPLRKAAATKDPGLRAAAAPRIATDADQRRCDRRCLGARAV